MDNRLPLLLDAAKKALVAIGDHAATEGHQWSAEKMRYLAYLKVNDAMPQKQLETAFYALREAIRLFEETESGKGA